MKDLSAAIALQALASAYDEKNADKVARWLETTYSVGERWDLADVRARIASRAGLLAADLGPLSLQMRPASRDGPPEVMPQTREHLEALAEDLSKAPPEALIAVFPRAVATKVRVFGDVWFGPGAEVLPDQAGNSRQRLAIAITQDACARAAALRGTERLRQALGSLYLAAALVGQPPALGARIDDRFLPGVYLAPAGGDAYGLAPDTLTGSALKPLDVDAILSSEEAAELMSAILGPRPADLALRRGRQGAAWLQRGFDAVSFADAVLAFGVALECVVGDESSGNTVENISRRCGLLLVEDSYPLARLDRSKQAKRLYDWRSRVAHGRFEPAAQPATELDRVRAEFAGFVAEVTTAFAQKALAEQWQTYEDLRDWYELALLA